MAHLRDITDLYYDRSTPVFNVNPVFIKAASFRFIEDGSFSDKISVVRNSSRAGLGLNGLNEPRETIEHIKFIRSEIPCLSYCGREFRFSGITGA